MGNVASKPFGCLSARTFSSRIQNRFEFASYQVADLLLRRASAQNQTITRFTGGVTTECETAELKLDFVCERFNQAI